MITYVVCDLFLSPARVLVNTVNTVGVMGKGIAKEFKTIYPEMFLQYQGLCENRELDIGKLWLYKTANKWVLNFPTKRHWRQPSKPEYIEAGLKKFVDTYHVYGITAISFPLLGCGNGELDWEKQVQPLMERYLKKLPITVFIHLQQREDPFTPEHRDVRAMQDWLRGEPESLAFAEVWDDLYEVLKNPLDLQCTDTDEKFCAVADQSTQSIVLEIAGKTVTLPTEAITDLWQQIRRAGLVTKDSLPSGLDSLSSYLVPIMSLLPYVSPVILSNQYSKISKHSVGIRLAPRTRLENNALLASIKAVEPA